MKTFYSIVVSLGPAVLMFGLVLMLVYYFKWRSAPEPKKRLSAWLYVLFCLVGAVPPFIAGTVAGIWLACSSPDSSNLCGLVGVFGLGPLLAGVAIWGCAYILTSNAKQAP